MLEGLQILELAHTAMVELRLIFITSCLISFILSCSSYLPVGRILEILGPCLH